jgi:hypothetical protein
MHAFGLIRMSGGQPDVDFTATSLYGYNLIGSLGGWGAYLVSGTAAQLTALNALSQVVGICVITNSGDVRWAELDGNIAAAIRMKLNTWLSNRGYPTIPAGWTYRRVVREVFQRINAGFEIEAFDVDGPADA